MKDVRIGFIGCGSNARLHMNNLKALQGATIVAICDLEEDAAAEAGQLTGARTYTDYNRMLDEEQLDAVYLSIPVFAHGEPELAVIDRGLPFFVEKPVALNLDVASVVLKRLAEANVMTCVGYQLRYLSHAQALKSWLLDKRIGLLSGHYWVGSGRNGRWHVQMEKSGGQLVEQATHTLDLFRYFAGEIDEVFSYQANRVLENFPSPDAYTVALRFSNGVLGSFSSVWHGPSGDWTQANIINLFAENYRVHFNYDDMTVTPDDDGFHIPGSLVTSIDQAFVEAVRTGDQSLILSPYEEGVRSLAISLAPNESARTGQPVSVGKMLKDAGIEL